MSSTTEPQPINSTISGTFDKKLSFEKNRVNTLPLKLFLTASYLTDPICKCHEIYRRISIIGMQENLTNPERKIFLYCELVAWAFLAFCTTFLGVILRAAALLLQTQPFCHIQKNPETMEDFCKKELTLLSWNICGINGGYATSDGGIIPVSSSRVDRICEKIIETNADTVVLFEVFDPKIALKIIQKLSEVGYKDFYFNSGAQALGVSSGIFVASKYAVKNPKFIPFPKDTLIGRTKHTQKGVFTFTQENSAEIFATHLQHSELPAFPTEAEKVAREKEMKILVNLVDISQNDSNKPKCKVVTGDLNLDDAEYENSLWSKKFLKNPTFGDKKSWGGDAFCAKLTQKKASKALNLDHTMIAQDSAISITTQLVETSFNAKYLDEHALSDHLGLLSTIKLL